MSDELDFASLIPPRLKINNLPDGSSIALMRRAEMGGSDYAGFLEIQKRVEELEAKSKKANNQTARVALLAKLEEELGNILKFLSPEMTPETLSGIKYGQRLAIIQWYGKQENEAASPNGSGDQTKENYI